MKVTSYIFRKVGEQFAYVGKDEVLELSPAAMDCMKAQYRLMGYKVEIDMDILVMVTKVEEDPNIF